MSDDRGPDPRDKERPAPGAPGPSGELQVPPQRQPAPGGPPTRPPYELVATPIPRPEPGRGERFTSWWSRPSTILVVVLVVVLLLITTTVFATLAITGGSPTAAPNTSPSPSPSPSESPTSSPPLPTDTPEPPGPPTGSPGPDSPAPDGGVSLPPTPADAIGARYQSGTHEESFPGPTRGYDFDGATEIYVGGTFEGEDGDAAVTRFGLVGLNGNGFAPARNARPRLGDCTSTPRQEWVLDVPVAQLKANATFCVTTTDGRYGYLTVQGAQKNNAGQLTWLEFIFQVWEGPND